MPLNTGHEFDSLDSTTVQGTVTIDDTTPVEAKAGASALQGREVLFIQNRGSGDIAVGGPGVTFATGMRLTKNQAATIQAGPNNPQYIIGQLGVSKDVVIVEYS